MTYMDLYGHALHKKPCPRGHEFYIFGRTFLGQLYYILGLSYLNLIKISPFISLSVCFCRS